jgi:hypothetical protein
MPYRFTFDEQLQLFECDYTGVVTFEQRKQAIDDGVKLLRDKVKPCLLINLIAAKMNRNLSTNDLLPLSCVKTVLIRSFIPP